MTLTQSHPTDLGAEDQALKAKHRAMWALGNYNAMVTDVISDLGPILVEATLPVPAATSSTGIFADATASLKMLTMRERIASLNSSRRKL